jgi:hypothetical protein
MWHPALAAPSMNIFTYGGELNFAYSMPRNQFWLHCVENRSRHDHKDCQNLDLVISGIELRKSGC